MALEVKGSNGCILEIISNHGGAAKVLEKYEQAIIDACANAGNRDFFYTAPDNDGGGFDPLYYLLCEPRNTRSTRRRRIVAKLRLYGFNKDGSKIVRNKNNESNETVDNNKQALPPTNPPTQHTNKNNLWLLAEAATGC